MYENMLDHTPLAANRIDRIERFAARALHLPYVDARKTCVTCLGGLAVTNGGKPLELTGRPRDVVVALLCRRDAQAKASDIAAEIWPHGEKDYALGALNTTLYRLRRHRGLGQLVQLKDGMLQIHPSCHIDRRVLDAALDAAATLLALGARQNIEDAQELSAVAALVSAVYRGPLLEQENTDGAKLTRAQMRVRLMDVAGRIDVTLADDQKPGTSLSAQLQSVDPFAVAPPISERSAKHRDVSAVQGRRAQRQISSVPVPLKAGRRLAHRPDVPIGV
jgi:hypothetical protein